MVNRRNLENLTRGSRPVLHQSAPDWVVLKGLVERAEDALFDAGRPELNLATRFSTAYGAAFWLARTALEASGFRLAGAEGNRTAAFQCLPHTVGWNETRWRRLDDLHRFRNRFDYGDIVDVPEGQVKTLIEDAIDLLQAVRDEFPELSAN